MIKFFRNIRQKIIKEGKTANYLKYAIGEIVLVVIGILIALQINNWNENRKNRIIEKKYLVSISNDLSEIKETSNRVYLKRLDQKLEGLYLAKKYAQNQISIQDTLAFLHKTSLGALFYSGLNVKEKDSYDELVSTGRLRLIENDSLRKEITKFFSTIKLQEKLTQSYVSNFGPTINALKPFNDSIPDYIEKYDQIELLNAYKTDTLRKLIDQEITYSYKIKRIAEAIIKYSVSVNGFIKDELKRLN
ncbi:MAG TPA: DUF6090 family protein [Flavobacteriaceae bacterium]|nr:DUF6090 family protein [Flavobacteriaceae bacterium]